MGNQAKQQGERGIWLLPAAAATYLEILFLAGRLSLRWRRRRQRLGLSGVYSKLMSCGTNRASDRILVHTESLLYPQSLGPRSTGSKCGHAGPPCHPWRRDSRPQKLLLLAASQFTPPPSSYSGWREHLGDAARRRGTLCHRAPSLTARL